MLTAGVDLAAEPKGTALAIVKWSKASIELIDLQLGVHDETIVAVAKEVEKIGIDCALGWPIEFIEFVNQHAQLNELRPVFDGGMDWRRRITYRESDRRVREITGRWPLSVATDRLGLTAMRAAGLLAKIQQQGIEVDRSGAGKVVEIYPGASLRLWGFDTREYRVSEKKRAQLVADLKVALPTLKLGSFEKLMVASCDAFDAVIAAMAARSAAIGKATKPEPEFVDQAKIEGWIALPNHPIFELVEI